VSEWDEGANYQLIGTELVGGTQDVGGTYIGDDEGYSVSVGAKGANGGTYVTLNGYGVAVTQNLGILSELFQAAGIENTAEGIPYRAYISPIAPYSTTLEITGEYADKLSETPLLEKKLSAFERIGLGDTLFPAVIVPNAYVMANIRTNPLWSVYGLVYPESSSVNTNGFFDANGNIVASSICGEYDVLVNPHGVRSWMNGSIECVLETYWLSNKFAGLSDDILRTKIREFYRQFYRRDLTDAEIVSILGGSYGG
jgi:hypothetical protein